MTFIGFDLHQRYITGTNAGKCLNSQSSSKTTRSRRFDTDTKRIGPATRDAGLEIQQVGSHTVRIWSHSLHHGTRA
jgi:hypothetical protein